MPAPRTRPIDDLVFEVFRLNARLLAAGDDAVKEVGLTSARWQVLGAVALSPDPLPVAQIARNMGLTRQAVQRLTNEMVADGLVEMGENPQHKRARLVHITDAGSIAYETALSRWRQEWTVVMEEMLSESEIIETMKRLRRLRGVLQHTSKRRRPMSQ